MAKLSSTRIYGTANVDSTLYVGGSAYITGNVTANSITTTLLPLVLSDISSQFDGTTCVFNLTVDQSNVTNIMDSKNLEVVINGYRLSPYVKELRYPWLTPYDSFKGYKVSTQNTASSLAQTLTIYNAPWYNEQAILTIINSSSSPQTKKYPYSAATIALGD